MDTLNSAASTLAQPMALIGILGQSCFFLRFLIQWIVSEKQRESTVPIIFWYFSISGACLTFTYAYWRADPVFMIGQSVGIFVYIRNLALIYRKRRMEATP